MQFVPLHPKHQPLDQSERLRDDLDSLVAVFNMHMTVRGCSIYTHTWTVHSRSIIVTPRSLQHDRKTRGRKERKNNRETMLNANFNNQSNFVSRIICRLLYLFHADSLEAHFYFWQPDASTATSVEVETVDSLSITFDNQNDSSYFHKYIGT